MTGSTPAEDLTAPQAAQSLGISPSRVYDLIAAGRLPAHRGTGRGRPWRIRPADLANVAERRPGWPGQRRHRHKGDPR